MKNRNLFLSSVLGTKKFLTLFSFLLIITILAFALSKVTIVYAFSTKEIEAEKVNRLYAISSKTFAISTESLITKVNASVPAKSSPVITNEITANVVTAYPTYSAIIGVPVKIFIPTIDVNARILQEGTTSDGRMDVPNNSIDVGWYKSSVKPGEQGNAVLDGHKMNNTLGGVFVNLHKLKSGDSVYILDENGVEREFKVNYTKIFDYKAQDLQEIFWGTGENRIVIITCHGNWIAAEQDFDQRFIVFADLV